MDEVKRQTGMHLEYEPEWEGAFNLQMRVDDVISSFTEWCSTDVRTFFTSYGTLLLLLNLKIVRTLHTLNKSMKIWNKVMSTGAKLKYSEFFKTEIVPFFVCEHLISGNNIFTHSQYPLIYMFV